MAHKHKWIKKYDMDNEGWSANFYEVVCESCGEPQPKPSKGVK